MKSFQELTLSSELMRSIKEMGFETPSPIQAGALPVLLGKNTDFIGLAATGTGKTAAFAIPLLERINVNVRRPQAVVLCPTRELAIQVCQQINLLGKHKRVMAVAVYGGASYGDQIRGIRQGAEIIVGTPGRIVDHLDRGTLSFKDVRTVVLDEADEMISMGFKEDLETILKKTSRNETENAANIWLFSATMSRDVRAVADAYLRDPRQVQVNRKEMLPSTIEQIYYRVHESDKPEVLCKLIDQAESFYGLIFCQTKSLVADLTKYLVDRGYRVDCLHGDKDQRARERTMQAFRDRKVTMLVCTDVASRGLDVKDVTHVINYSIPRELDNYVHRIGRTARSGKTGFAFSLVTNANRALIPRIENMTRTRMIEGKIPSRRDIGAKKVSQFLPKFVGEASYSRAIDMLGEDWKKTISDMSREEIVARFLAMKFPEVFAEKLETSMPGPAARPLQDSRDMRDGREVNRRDERRRFAREREKKFGGRQPNFRERKHWDRQPSK